MPSNALRSEDPNPGELKRRRRGLPTWCNPVLTLLRYPRFSPGNSAGDARLILQLPALLREHRLDPMVGEGNYCIPAGFTSWSSHWVQVVGL